MKSLMGIFMYDGKQQNFKSKTEYFLPKYDKFIVDMSVNNH